MDSRAPLAVALASVVAVLYIAAIAYATVHIARIRDLFEVEKALWMIAAVFAPLLGALVCYFAGPHPFGLRLTYKVR